MPSPALMYLQVTESTLPTLPNLPSMPPTIARYCTLGGGLLPWAKRRTSAVISAAVRGRPGARHALPSYFLAINFRCQASKVAGVTMVATCSRIFRLSFFALAARRHRWLSVNRIRRFPICSRRTRFSSVRYSTTCCWCWFIQPATETTRKEMDSNRRAFSQLSTFNVEAY